MLTVFFLLAQTEQVYISVYTFKVHNEVNLFSQYICKEARWARSRPVGGRAEVCLPLAGARGSRGVVLLALGFSLLQHSQQDSEDKHVFGKTLLKCFLFFFQDAK